MNIGTQCWRCEEPVAEERLDYEAVLVPRSAARGGPVLLWRCPSCGTDNVAERNRAKEVLLVPPHLAGMRSGTVRGKIGYEARKWASENAIRRADFLSRTAPERTRLPEAEPPEPAEPEPVPAEDPPDPPDPHPRPPAPRALGSVLDAYEVLGLPVTADVQTIRRRYRELSRKCHPDRVADLDEEIRRTAERRFREIRRAYEALMGEG
jgi:DnaJ-domain-containing protein 1